jgi:hypothetical protein
MPARVGVDVIPEAGRPEPVAAALRETSELRDRVRAAAEEVAARQQALDELEREDVQAAAQRVRQGGQLGTPAAAIAKARGALDVAKRNHAAMSLAHEGAEADLAQRMHDEADAWAATLHRLDAEHREQAGAALETLERSLREMAATASAAAWVRSGQADGRWDRPQRQMLVGAVAPSSVKRVVNGEPLQRNELIAYLRELVGSPTPERIENPDACPPSSGKAVSDGERDTARERSAPNRVADSN